MIAKQFTLYMENKPGELSVVTKKLAAAEVNIEGISVAESTDVAIVQLVVDSVVKTRNILASSRIPFTMQDVAVVPLMNEPGALANMLNKLAKSKVHINYVYATASACRHGCRSYAIVSANNLHAVQKICNGRG